MSEFKHHPDCNRTTWLCCKGDGSAWGFEPSTRCKVFSAGYQAGLAAGEAKGRAEATAEIVADLRDRPMTKAAMAYFVFADRYERGEHTAKADGGGK